MPFWLRLLLLYVLLGAALSYLAGIDWRLALELFLLAAALMPAIVRHSPRAWLLMKRAHYWLTNASTAWHVNLLFAGEFRDSQLRNFVRELSTQDGGSTRILEESDGRVLLHFRRLFVIEIALRSQFAVPGAESSNGREYEALTFTLLDQHVGYRRSKDVLENALVPLVEKMKEKFTPVAGNYAMRVGFEGVNPFLSLYLQQLQSAEVRGFELELATPGAAREEYFRVTLRELVLNAGSLEAFRRQALNGLAFGAMGR